MCDCVRRYVVSFLLNLTVTCHTEDIYYFARVTDGDVSLIREGIPFNFQRGSLVQGYIQVHIHAILLFHGQDTLEKRAG